MRSAILSQPVVIIYNFPVGKIISREQIVRVITGLKENDKKIVFTNGCFDIIHVGHVRYLKEAKQLGDILVVGINSDISVSRIKPGRPVIPEHQRAEVVSTLEMVDFVTIFDEDTPYELIRELKPDVLVKGADWRPDDIVGRDIVPEVRIIPVVKGVSTTSIIERIRGLFKDT